MAAIVGRERDVRCVIDVLERERRCMLVGPGGVGKTTVVSTVVASFGERALLIDARHTERAEQLMAHLAFRLDADHLLDSDDPALVCARLAARLNAAGTELLAVDHIDGRDETLLDAVTRIGDGSVGLATLVATRNHPSRPFGEVVRLRPLDVDDSGEDSAGRRLFRDAYRRAGGNVHDLAAHPGRISNILSTAGGLPLAIIVLASRAALIGLDSWPNDIDQPGMAHNLAADVDPVDVALEESLGDVDGSTRRVFETLGTFRSDPSFSQVVAVSGLDPATVTRAIEQLARRSLVEVKDELVTMLPPVRNLANRLCTLSGDRTRLERRHVEWAYEMSRADPPPTTREVLAVERDLVRSIAASFDEDRLDTAIAIARLLDDAFRSDLRHQRRVDTLEPVLQACREAAMLDPDDDDCVDALLELIRLTASAHADATSAAQATVLLGEARTYAEKTPQGEQQLARIEAMRAALYFESGDLDAARRVTRSVIDLSPSDGVHAARLAAQKVLADIELESGDLDAALIIAHEIVRTAPPTLRGLKAYALATIGACELECGRYSIALSIAEQVASEARKSGDVDLLVESDWLMAMADPRRASAGTMDLDGERVGHSVIHLQADIARSLRHLANGDLQPAITLAADCEVRASALPMVSLGIDAQLIVGAAASELGEHTEALRAFRQVLLDATRLGYRLRVADALDGLADVVDRFGATSAAHDALSGCAATIRGQLGVVRRPAPWRDTSATQPGRAPAGWVAAGALSATGLDAALASLTTVPSPGGSATERLSVLSPAERTVAELVAAGHTNQEIGERLFVSRRTVETHISHSFQKLGVTSRTQLATVVLTQASL